MECLSIQPSLYCIPCLLELLATFFYFGIFTSSSSCTLKLTVASLCNTLRHLDVSADTAVDFPTEVLFSERMMSLRAQ